MTPHAEPGPLRRYALEHGHDEFLAWVGRRPRADPRGRRGVAGDLLVARLADTPPTPSQRLPPDALARRRQRRAQRAALRALARLLTPLVVEAAREAVARDTVAIAARLVRAALEEGKRP